ncbi:GNAT family N-acetyltransferase [Pedobacter arcticus]|uniref:GNAT family N-acetyltransferase n=1 Tax=Pedobacter arcticus TaxID=752140 RepID=UPI0002E6EAB2|nr:GNAT family N-acetyltransferase [Pedobacter arcticus]
MLTIGSISQIGLMRLVQFKKEHFQILVDWIIDEDTMLKFAGIGFKYPLSTDQLENYILKHPDRLIYLGIDENEKPVAYGEIIPQDADSARLGHLIIGESERRGKGLGQTLIELLNHEAKRMLAIKRMDLFLLQNNLAAEKCYLKYGFEFVKNDFQINHKGKSYDILKMTIAL